MEGARRIRAEAHQARRVGQGDAMGGPDPLYGLSVLALSSARNRERREPDERDRNRGLLRPAGSGRSAPVLGRPRHQVQGASPGNRRMGHHAEGLFRAQGRDGLDDDGKPDQRAHQRQVRFRGGDAARGQAARQPDRRRQLLLIQEEHAGTAAGRAQVHQVGHDAAARGAVGNRHRLRRRACRCVGDAGDEEVRGGLPRRGGRARPVAVRKSRTVDARQPASHSDAERWTAGGADRDEDARAGDEGCAARGGPVVASLRNSTAARSHVRRFRRE